MKIIALAALALAARSVAAAPPRHLLVVCAPGSPGTTGEAQPTMDALAAAVAAKAGLPSGSLGAVYEETEAGGVARLRAKEAALALVSLPFYLAHERELGLEARLQPVPKGRSPTERWALVARKGRVTSPAALEGFTLASSVGWAPGFVRGPALGAWGAVPKSVKIVQSAAVLSALRRAAAGEPVAVLLDGAQEAALSSLPFAAQLEVVTRSPPLPGGVVARVDARLPEPSWRAVEAALRGLASDAAGAAVLETMQVERFEPVDAQALARAHQAYAGAAR